MFLGCSSALIIAATAFQLLLRRCGCLSAAPPDLCVQASVPKDRPVTPPRVKAKEARQAAKAAAQAPKAAPPKASEYVELLKKVG